MGDFTTAVFNGDTLPIGTLAREHKKLWALNGRVEDNTQIIDGTTLDKWLHWTFSMKLLSQMLCICMAINMSMVLAVSQYTVLKYK